MQRVAQGIIPRKQKNAKKLKEEGLKRPEAPRE
jgi:hypothetical protein